MKNRFKKFLPLLSLLAALAVIALWIVSYRVEEGIAWTDWKKVVILSVDRGDFLVSGYSNVNPVDLWTPAGLIAGSEPIGRIRHAAALAQLAQTIVYMKVVIGDRQSVQPFVVNEPFQSPSAPSTTTVLYSPTGDFTIGIWPIVLILLMLPARWLGLRMKAHKRSRVGLCRKCGYDLRATLERCPECGTEVKRPRPTPNAH